MYNLTLNYRLRKCFLEKEEVPTQTLIKKTMSPALADIYFKSMPPKIRVLAGLEPPLQGGGTSWYIPPEDLLHGRVVMKPLKKEYMSKWNCYGVDEIGMELLKKHRTRMEEEKEQIVFNRTLESKQNLDQMCRELEMQYSVAAAKSHTVYITNVLDEFKTLYSTSLTKLQDLLLDAAISEIKNYQFAVQQKIQTKYEYLLQQQSNRLKEKYDKQLIKAKKHLKGEFVLNLENCKKTITDNLHDINVEKHIAIEKLRHLLECQTLANQIYVALIERQIYDENVKLQNKKHTKINKLIDKEIAYTDIKIQYAQEKEMRRLELESIWKKKVGHVIKKFQTFVSYCLKMLPEYAEFFINLETLLLLQLSEALEFPSVSSMFVTESEPFHTPVPMPHPFYLFCDKNYKPNINPGCCPKHCTSSASQLPVIVINKRCVYSACDNFEQLADKLKDFVNDSWGEDEGIQDKHDYSRDVPVQCPSSQQLIELKLKSSLFQILQQETPNPRKVPIECVPCGIPHCFSDCNTSSSSYLSKSADILKQSPLISTDHVILTQRDNLFHRREPKVESYTRYIESKKCDCAKKAKKHLLENLPVYMRKINIYDKPELFNYERCTSAQLKKLVNKAKHTTATPKKALTESNPEIATQTSDYEYDYLCTCFSDESINRFYAYLSHKNQMAYKQQSLKKVVKDTRVLSDSPPVPLYSTKDRKSMTSIRASYFNNRLKDLPSTIQRDADCPCPY